jgi:hypothetical protein
MSVDWHRLFGLVLIDFFAGSPFVVELEKELSLKKQFLDVVILRQGKGRFQGRLPDGLDNLAAHILITFKSHHESLDDWALKELTGHYVNYRKQLSPPGQPLLPETEFRLYAVCSRYPHNLANEVAWQELQPGVYHCQRGTDAIRVVVAGQLPEAEQNALLHLFSGDPDRLRFGRSRYRQRSGDVSPLVLQLLKGYQSEGLAMPYTMEEFRRDYAKEHFKDLTPEEQKEALQSVPAEKVLSSLPLDEIEKYLRQHREAASSSQEKGKVSRTARRKPKRG